MQIFIFINILFLINKFLKKIFCELWDRDTSLVVAGNTSFLWSRSSVRFGCSPIVVFRRFDGVVFSSFVTVCI